jgi:exoribonuclease-2
MNVFYEEDGGFKVGTILADNTASLQVEAPHGKRSKIKAANVLLRFGDPAADFMERAQRAADEIDLDFLWQCCGPDEFGFDNLGAEYFGHAPNAVEAAGLLIKLHGAPMYFYKKGKGRYKAAPEDALKAALASVERKKREAEQMARWVEQLTHFEMPPELTPHLNMLLYKPDRNTLECKALEQACHATGLTAPKLLEKCGALPGSHDYHFGAFLVEHFPRGTGFDEAAHALPDTGNLPESDAPAFSIDDAATTEIDDAFSVIFRDDGRVRVGIHIAVPALGIVPGSDLDRIAATRLSTVYMPGDKITMLPEPLVERYTLAENRDCPALSLYVEVAPDYSIRDLSTQADTVRIAANLRHETLEPLFNDDTIRNPDFPDYAYRRELEWLWGFACHLEAARGKADQVQRLDYLFKVEGEQVRIQPRVRGNPIDKLVSELMILANNRWGRLLADHDIAGLYRVQTAGKVRMTVKPAAHEGLGLDCYAWSTSPLRRYVDLVNQRQILAAVNGDKAPRAGNDPMLFAVMRDFELAYDAYAEFQRRMERYWCLRWLLQEGVTEIDAAVLRENLIRLDGMPLVTRMNGAPALNPGDRVRVAVADIDLLDIELSCRYVTTLAS